MADAPPEELREQLEHTDQVGAACAIVELAADKLLATWEHQGPCRPRLDHLLPRCPNCASDEVSVQWETYPAERKDVVLVLRCVKFERVPAEECRCRRVIGLSDRHQAEWARLMKSAEHGPREPGPDADDHYDTWVDWLLEKWPDEYRSPAGAKFPTACQAGSPGKVKVMEAREKRGQSLWHPQDCPELIATGVSIGTGRNGRVFRRGLENLLALGRQLRRTA